MRSSHDAFHLAIPCRDLDGAERFYADQLGCRVGRRRSDRITFEFFGDQVVCHLSPGRTAEAPEIYPRHFGVTFRTEDDYEAMLERARRARLDFLREPFLRFEGEPEEHRAFFLVDPSNNVLEFKHYADPAMMH